MIIQEMTNSEVEDMLRRGSLGRLACSKDNQPYITPLSFAFQAGYLYSFTTVGQKVEWMRENPQVCVLFDEILSIHQWQSVLVAGRYEELTKSTEQLDARNTAYTLLQKRVEWWEPAYVRTLLGDKVRQMDPVYFRIPVLKASGHKAIRDE